MGHQPQSFVSTFNTQGQVLNFYVQLWRYSQNQCICWKFWNTWINLCDQTTCFSFFSPCFNLNRLLSQVYTFNSTLETAKVWLKNGRKRPHDKVKHRPAEQFVALFCVTPHFLLLLWQRVFIILQLLWKGVNHPWCCWRVVYSDSGTWIA